MKKKYLLLGFIFSLLTLFQFTQAQESENPYVVSFESKYNHYTASDHLRYFPKEWQLWNGFTPIKYRADAPNGDSAAFCLMSAHPEVQIYTCYFEVTTADTFSFWFYLDHGPSSNLANHRPYVGYIKFGEFNGGHAKSATYFDTLDLQQASWKRFRYNFPVNGVIKLVIYANADPSWGNWKSDNQVSAGFDFFTTSAKPIYSMPPKITIKLDSGALSTCVAGTKKFKADTLINYTNPREITWYKKNSGITTLLTGIDSILESNSIAGKDTIFAVLKSAKTFDPLAMTSLTTAIYDTSNFITFSLCQEYNEVKAISPKACYYKAVSILTDWSAPINWPNGTTFQVEVSNPNSKTWASTPVKFGPAFDKSEVNPKTTTAVIPNAQKGAKYYFRVTSSNGVTSTKIDSVQIFSPTFTISNDTAVCKGASIWLRGTGGIAYKWSNTGTSEDILVGITKDSTFFVTITEADGTCDYYDTVQITTTLLPKAYTKSNDTSVCQNATITLKATGKTAGATYLWAGGGSETTPTISRTISSATSSKFYVTVTEATACAYKDSVIVTTVLVPKEYIKSNDTSVCPGSNVTFSIKPKTTNAIFNWSTSSISSSINATINSSQKFYVTIKEETSCVYSDSIIATAYSLPVANAGPDLEIAYFHDTTLFGSASGGSGVGYIYAWTPAQFLKDSTLLQPATKDSMTNSLNFTLIVKDSHGCISAPDQMSLTVKGVPLQVVISNKSVVDNPSFIKGTLPPNLDNVGCPGILNELVATAIGGVSTPYTYNWITILGQSGAAKDSLYTVSPTRFTQIIATVSDGVTSAIDTINITPHTLKDVIIEDKNIFGVGNKYENIKYNEGIVRLVLGDQLPLEATSDEPLMNYAWSYKAKNNNAKINNPTAKTTFAIDLDTGYTYISLLATDPNQCVQKDSMTVLVNEMIVYVPTAFTPNGDGQNDVFYIQGFGIKEIDFKLYNRWGELIWETDDINRGWDGTYKEKIQHMQTFGYILKATDVKGNSEKIIGNVTILK